MEREILIANTKTQKRSKINSTATTLAELKAELSAAGIDYSGMTFTEGISKTQLLDDATQLPSNVIYKGQLTNNLVILLTNTKKNIASGASDRAAAYMAIKDNNLQDAVKKYFGRNFTQVSTDALWDFITDNLGAPAKPMDLSEEKEEEKEVEEPVNEDPEEMPEEDYEEYPYTIVDLLADERILNIKDSIFHHIAMLADEKVLDASNISSLIGNLKDLLGIMKNEAKVKSEPVSTSDGSINDDDIDDMINDIL